MEKGIVLFVENKVSRVEVIDETGRVYVGYGQFEFSVQDDERTVKIFATRKPKIDGQSISDRER